MARITPVSVQDALTARTNQPSTRTLRRHRIEQDSERIYDALIAQGAAVIDLTEEDMPADSYLNSLRAAFRRRERSDVLIQKRRNQDKLVAWLRRPEDEARIATRKKRGQELGENARQRATRGRRG